MKVEIYGSAESHTVRGATVNFNADSAAPVTEFVAGVNPNGFDGRTGVDINKNGTTQSVAFGKTCYGGSANVTTGTLTEEYGGGAYDPQNVPAEVKSEVESKLTLETATPGDIVSFDCELGEYPLNSLSFPLAPIQDLHGYDHPWPAGGGKNKLKITASTSTHDGVTMTVNRDAYGNVFSVSLNGTATAMYDFQLFNVTTESFVLDNATYYLLPAPSNVKLYLTISNNGATRYIDALSAGTKSFTIADGDVIVAAFIRVESGAALNNLVVYPEIASENTSTFAPYSNICPITGRTGVSVYRTGKNLADISNAANATNVVDSVDADGKIHFKDVTARWSSTYIGKMFVKAGETYTLSGGIAYGRIGFSTDTSRPQNGVNIPDITVLGSGSVDSFLKKNITVNSFTANYTGYMYAFYCSDANYAEAHGEFSCYVFCNVGSTATTYEPYNGTTYAIDWTSEAGTVYGGTLDVTAGTMTVDRVCTTESSSTGWTVSTSEERAFKNFADIRVHPDNLTPSPYVFTNYLPKISFQRGYIGKQQGVFIGMNSKNVCVHIDGVTNVSAAAFNTYLSEHPLQICYTLATPVEITLDPVTISTISGQTNNVWADAGEISELKYYDGDITDTDIQTENGVLVTGDKLFYALSSPRTSSFTPTAVNTVQGKNTMSANTGNIAVTYTSNWFDITPWIAWQGLTFSRNDVDAHNAGRDMSGYMHRGRVASKEKINIQTVQLTRAQSSKLQTLLFPETIMVRVTPYPRTNGMQVLYMYSNNVKTTYVIHRESGEDLQSLSFPLIEN